MMQRIVVVALVGTACNKPADKAPPVAQRPRDAAVAHDAAATPRADEPVFTFTPSIGGGAYEMKYGRVVQDGNVLAIWLSGDTDPGCDRIGKGRSYFNFKVPAGPGGTFYTKAPFGPLEPGGGVRGETGLGFSSAYIAITLEPFELTADAHVHGRVRSMNLGSGAFDAIVCPGIKAAELHRLRATAPDAPVFGTIGGTPFTAGSALAFAEKQGSTSLISHVELFADNGVTCATRDKHAGSAMVHIGDIGGTSDAIKLEGTPQPARMSFRIGKDTHYAMDDSAAWVQLDTLGYTAGDRIKGRTAIETSPTVGAADAAALTGRFEAIVCAR